MKNLKEFSKEYFSQKKKYKETRDRLQKAVDKACDKLSLLKRPTSEGIVKPLALAIQKELKAKAYYVVDIESIWSTVKIVWVLEPDMTKCKNKHEVGILEINTLDEEWVVVERAEDGQKEYIINYGNKGIKWLAKYAKQNLKKKRT